MTMNSLKFFLFLLLSVLMFSCGQETSPEEQSPEPAAPTTENPASSSATNPITVTGDPSLIPDQGAAAPAGVGSTQHYYCPNKCAGSGGNAGGKCPTCGADYVHNDAYHLQGGAAPAAAPAGAPAGAPPTAEPAQNAAGIWHYSCPKGCPGGAASAGACAKCGTALAHDGRYHSN